MPHPDGSLRKAAGFDRVSFLDASSTDLVPGQGRALSLALEDGIYRGMWVTSIWGSPSFIVFARIDCITEFRPDTLAVLERDDALYRAQEKADELLNGGE